MYPQDALDGASNSGFSPAEVTLELLSPEHPGHDPANNRLQYTYSLDVPKAKPTVEQFQACADKMTSSLVDNVLDYAGPIVGELGVELIKLVKDNQSTLPDVTKCLTKKKTGLCALEWAFGESDFLLDKLANIDVGAAKTGGLAFLANEATNYLGYDPSSYTTANIKLAKLPEKGYVSPLDISTSGRVNFTKSNVDFLSTNGLPTLVAGPMPPIMDETSPIVAYNESNGDVVDFPDGAQFDEGVTLKLRAFDNFYDKSDGGNQALRRATQHYNCADYKWTVTRNGQSYITAKRQGNEDGLMLDNLPAGNYEATIRVNNNGALSQGINMNAEWYANKDGNSGLNISQDEAVGPLPVAETSVEFVVGEPQTLLVRSDRMSSLTLLAIPGGLYPENLEVRAVDSLGNGVPGLDVKWSGYGSARGGAWDMRRWWEDTGKYNDDEVIVRTDANGYASVPWKLGRYSNCYFGGEESPQITASLVAESARSVAFKAKYAPREQRGGWPQVALSDVEMSTGPDTTGIYPADHIGSIDIKMTWEDPLGAANDGNCVGGGGASLSIVANRFVLQTTTNPFTYIHRVRWEFWPPLPPGTEFMLNTSINVVGGRTTPITDQTVITAE